MTRTTMYLPEEPGGLIAETVQMLLDARVSDVVLSLIPEGTERREHESDTEFAVRAWRALIPTANSGDYRLVRCQYGWTKGEARQVRALVDAIGTDLKTQSEAEGILSGTAETLRRSSDRLIPLWQRWDSLASGAY